MIGVFAAADVFLFYVFFEVMLVPMYFLIGSYGGARRQYAAVKFFLYSLVGGLFMLAAVIGLWVLGGHTFDWADADRRRTSPPSAERWLFLGFFIAFAIKAPFFPFHTWLPDAGGAAPAGAAALLVGVLDKVGTFGILRYCLPLFPNASHYFAPLALALALVGIIYARAARGRPERPEAAGRRTRRSRTSASSASASSPSPPRPAPARCSTWSTTASPPACSSWSSACWSPAAARRWSATSAAPASCVPVLAGVLLLRRSGLARAARHGAVRQRVPGADRHVHGEQDGRDRRDHRHHPGRRVRAVDGAAHHAGHAQPGAGARSTAMRKDLVAARGRWWSRR